MCYNVMYLMHYSEQAAETDDTCSASMDKDVREPSCISDTVLNAGDEVCLDTDVAGGDAEACSVNLSTKDTSSQHVNCAATETDLGNKPPESGDEIQADALEEEDAKPVGDGQADSKKVDSKLTWYFADIKKHWRKFNIDLMPKVIIQRHL